MLYPKIYMVVTLLCVLACVPSPPAEPIAEEGDQEPFPEHDHGDPLDAREDEGKFH